MATAACHFFPLSLSMFPAGRTICRSGLSSLQQRRPQPKQRVFPQHLGISDPRRGWRPPLPVPRNEATAILPTPLLGSPHYAREKAGLGSRSTSLLHNRSLSFSHTGEGEGAQAAAHRQLPRAPTPRGPEGSGTNRLTAHSSSNHPGPALDSLHLLPPRLTFQAGAQQLGRGRRLWAPGRAARKPPAGTEGAARR